MRKRREKEEEAAARQRGARERKLGAAGGLAAGGVPRRALGGASLPSCRPASGPCAGADLSRSSSGWGYFLQRERGTLLLRPS